MINRVITDMRQLTVAWFNAVLAKSGALRTGNVHNFDAHLVDSTNARFAAIRLSYEPGSTGTLPTALLLKMCSGSSGIFGPSEVHYYARDYVQLPNAPIPKCYDAQYSANPRKYHILMEDLSATHRNNWNIMPTLGHGYAVADALAAMHAHWWGADRLHTIGSPIPGPVEIERYIAHIQRGLLPMLDHLGNAIDSTWRRALIDVFEHHPTKMLERTKEQTGFTLVHGDVNPGNILSPIDGHGKTYLIDRQPFEWSLTTWLGVSDVAYMMVHWWDTDLRRQWELPILRQYHQSLMQYGVAGYTWEQLVRDYKLTAVQSIYVATEWSVLEEDRTTMQWVWLPQLHKAMAAFFDLDCETLWVE